MNSALENQHQLVLHLVQIQVKKWSPVGEVLSIYWLRSTNLKPNEIMELELPHLNTPKCNDSMLK